MKNTGRCEELLIPGAEVYLQKSENEKRATLWDLIAVKKKRKAGQSGFTDSEQVRGRMAANRQSVQRNPVYPSGDNLWRFKIRSLCRGGGEKSFYRSERGDTGRRRSLSVSDAPSERAVRHIEELIRAKKEGYEAILFFVIQMKEVRYFTPNQKTQPEFAEALKRAKAAGVKILAYDCEVSKDEIRICDPVDVVLESPQMKETVR